MAMVLLSLLLLLVWYVGDDSNFMVNDWICGLPTVSKFQRRQERVAAEQEV